MNRDDLDHDHDDAPDAAGPAKASPSAWSSTGGRRLIPPGPHKVGYGKPPEQHRFQPGRSGNPRGRPRGSMNRPKPGPFDERLNLIILNEAHREVSVPVQGQQVTLPLVELAMRTLTTQAVKGNVHAIRVLLDVIHRAETLLARAHEQAYRDLALFKIDATRELERCRRLGLDEPEIFPHPDDIHIHANGTYEVDGPLSKEQRDAAAGLLDMVQVQEEVIAMSTRKLKRLRNLERRAEMKASIVKITKDRDDILEALPPWAFRMRKGEG